MDTSLELPWKMEKMVKAKIRWKGRMALFLLKEYLCDIMALKKPLANMTMVCGEFLIFLRMF
jgi:hypothetical protein